MSLCKGVFINCLRTVFQGLHYSNRYLCIIYRNITSVEIRTVDISDLHNRERLLLIRLYCTRGKEEGTVRHNIQCICAYTSISLDMVCNKGVDYNNHYTH